jgi:hypothetical protein
VTGNCTATLRTVTTTTDDNGDTSIATADTVLDWAIIAPRSSVERVDPHAPAVITAATLYGPGGTAIDSDDLVIIADHSPAMNGEWQIDGVAGDWKSPYSDWHPGVEVALKRAGSV